MHPLNVALTELVEELRSVNIAAALDPRDLTLPGVLVTPSSVDFDRLGGHDYTLEADLYLVAGNRGTDQALGELTDLVAKLRGLWPVGQAEALSLDLPNHGGSMPALIVNLTLTVSKE